MMTDREVGAYWDRNADAWTLLARSGYDVYRDLVNTPGFLAMLPDVGNLRGLDIGCGEGNNTRLVAARGAAMTAVDISSKFVSYAVATPDPAVVYAIASGEQLPFDAATFDFATAFMSLMDIPQPSAALSEAARVLKPGGFLQFSIMHPCFFTPHRRLLRDAQGREYAVEVGRYFENFDRQVDEWLFSATPAEVMVGLKPFQVPIFHRTLSDWMNMIVGAGLTVEEVREPRADERTAARHPIVADTRLVAYFLHIRCRKR